MRRYKIFVGDAADLEVVATNADVAIASWLATSGYDSIEDAAKENFVHIDDIDAVPLDDVDDSELSVGGRQ